jgi:hypothetical protein
LPVFGVFAQRCGHLGDGLLEGPSVGGDRQAGDEN